MLHFASPDIGPFGRRQRHVRGHRVPVKIETTGGATDDGNTVVVLDEFGSDDLVPLRHECTCCTVRMRLQDRLRRLLDERAHGKVAHFSRISIRTSEDPGPIRRMFASPRALETECHLEGDPQFAAHADGVTRFTLTEEAPIAWEAFSRFMTALMRLRGAELLWAKGMLNVQGCRGPVVVQFEHHLASRPVELTGWLRQDRASRTEFVTRNIDRPTVHRLFEAVRALQSSALFCFLAALPGALATFFPLI